MTMPIEQPALALASMCLCAAMAWACLCRINAMSGDTTKTAVRAAYVLLFTDALAVATMPIWLPSYWAEAGLLCIVAGYLVVMVVNSSGWKNGPPPHARSRPAELDGPLDRVFDEPRLGP